MKRLSTFLAYSSVILGYATNLAICIQLMGTSVSSILLALTLAPLTILFILFTLTFVLYILLFILEDL